MNKDKIREIRNYIVMGGPEARINALCDALLEDGPQDPVWGAMDRLEGRIAKMERPLKDSKCEWVFEGHGLWTPDCGGGMLEYPASGYCPNCGLEIIVDDYGPDPPWPKVDNGTWQDGVDYGKDLERQRWIDRARLLRWPHDEGHTSEWWGGWNSVIGALLEDMGVSDE